MIPSVWVRSQDCDLATFLFRWVLFNSYQVIGLGLELKPESVLPAFMFCGGSVWHWDTVSS